MKVSKEALLLVVKAARMSLGIAERMRMLIADGGGHTFVDYVSGDLCDALFKMSGERLEKEQDFLTQSKTMKLLTGGMTDGDVTDAFIRMAQENQPEQPEPHFIDREAMRKSVRQNGGYMFETPEGDWT